LPTEEVPKRGGKEAIWKKMEKEMFEVYPTVDPRVYRKGNGRFNFSREGSV
jgi:hypothetical protein